MASRCRRLRGPSDTDRHVYGVRYALQVSVAQSGEINIGVKHIRAPEANWYLKTGARIYTGGHRGLSDAAPAVFEICLLLRFTPPLKQSRGPDIHL